MGSSFNRLLDLFTVREILYLHHSGAFETQRTSPCEISVQYLKVVFYGRCFPVFTTVTTFPRLVFLDICCSNSPRARMLDVWNFMRDHGSHLQHLRLDVHMIPPGGFDADQITNSPKLSSVCPDLRSLQVVFTIQSTLQLRLMAELLQSTPQTVSTVVSGIDPAEILMPASNAWAYSALDHLFDILNTFPELTSVTFMKPKGGNDIADDIT